MAYEAVIEARRAAEEKHDSVLEAVRLGLQMKREEDAKKAALRQERALRYPD
jgi:hypothetical protein